MGFSDGSSLLPIANVPAGSVTISGSLIAGVSGGCAGGAAATCGRAGAGDCCVCGLTAGAAAVAGFLATAGVCAGDRSALTCFGCHTKKYHVAVAAAALATVHANKMTAKVSPGIGRALTTAAGSGSTL